MAKISYFHNCPCSLAWSYVFIGYFTGYIDHCEHMGNEETPHDNMRLPYGRWTGQNLAAGFSKLERGINAFAREVKYWNNQTAMCAEDWEKCGHYKTVSIFLLRQAVNRKLSFLLPGNLPKMSDFVMHVPRLYSSIQNLDFYVRKFFSRVHATLHPALSVRPSVRRSVRPSVRHTLLFL